MPSFMPPKCVPMIAVNVEKLTCSGATFESTGCDTSTIAPAKQTLLQEASLAAINVWYITWHEYKDAVVVLQPLPALDWQLVTTRRFHSVVPARSLSTVACKHARGRQCNDDLGRGGQVLPALELARQARLQAQQPFLAALLAAGDTVSAAPAATCRHDSSAVLDPRDPLVRLAAERLGRLAAVRTARQQVLLGPSPTLTVHLLKHPSTLVTFARSS